MRLIQTEKKKELRSPEVNYDFDKENGKMVTWGKTLKDDPSYSPYGPFILDIEVSTICHGPGKPCSCCYKSNGPVGKNMSLDTFKKILNKMPPVLTQVAFGIGDIDSNPDLFKMFEYCRSKGVIPNVTVNGWRLSEAHLEALAKLCGAVAVSLYDKDSCYGTVQALNRLINQDNALRQVNIHSLLCEETYERCIDTMHDFHNDDRLADLNAIVFLMMKPKGDRNKFHKLSSLDMYKKLIDKAFAEEVPIGFDSCSAPSFLRVINSGNLPKRTKALMNMLAEPCESDCFSSYINVDGRFFHCSFTEDEPGWEGIDVLSKDHFLEDVWFSEEVVKFRHKLLDSEHRSGCRSCPIFNLELL